MWSSTPMCRDTRCCSWWPTGRSRSRCRPDKIILPFAKNAKGRITTRDMSAVQSVANPFQLSHVSYRKGESNGNQIEFQKKIQLKFKKQFWWFEKEVQRT